VHFAYQLPRSIFVVAVECHHFVLINCCTWELTLITLPVCSEHSRSPSLLLWSVLSLCFIPAPGPTFQICIVACCNLAFFLHQTGFIFYSLTERLTVKHRVLKFPPNCCCCSSSHQLHHSVAVKFFTLDWAPSGLSFLWRPKNIESMW
jgi:hypothetical protein